MSPQTFVNIGQILTPFLGEIKLLFWARNMDFRERKQLVYSWAKISFPNISAGKIFS